MSHLKLNQEEKWFKNVVTPQTITEDSKITKKKNIFITQGN